MISVDMPAVEACSVTECAYNLDSDCHARAITVGNGTHPGCETFLGGSTGHAANSGIAGVGACKMTGCRYNVDLECAAENIEVGMAGNLVGCMTYAPR
ncbi:MAG: DUF1540 domain-containing protein [Chromatiaceae bacterium]|jgi:hypothetical protein